MLTDLLCQPGEDGIVTLDSPTSQDSDSTLKIEVFENIAPIACIFPYFEINQLKARGDERSRSSQPSRSDRPEQPLQGWILQLTQASIAASFRLNTFQAVKNEEMRGSI